MSVDLSTTYLGLKLKNPLVIAASPMTQKLDSLIALEEKGAAAAVFPSLFEEQIESEETELSRVHDFGTDTFAEALTYFPNIGKYSLAPDKYIETLKKTKQSVNIPVLGSFISAHQKQDKRLLFERIIHTIARPVIDL